MDIPLDEVLFFDAITSDSSGVATDADSTPSFEVFEEATDTDIGVGGNMTKRTSKTGHYRGSITLSAANGFEAGKWYSVVATATVGGNAGKAVLKSFRVVAAETSAGVPKVDNSHWRGQAIPETNQTGVPVVDVAYVDGTGVEPGVVDANVVSIENDAIDAASLALDAVALIQVGLSTLDADDVRTALGLAAANLDAQLGDLPTAVITAMGTGTFLTQIPYNDAWNLLRFGTSVRATNVDSSVQADVTIEESP